MLTRLSRDGQVESSEVDDEGESDGLTRARRSDNSCPVVRDGESDGSTAKEDGQGRRSSAKRKERRNGNEETRT